MTTTTMATKAITSFSGKYRFLSNFFDKEGTYPVTLYNIGFPRVENAYQAAKVYQPVEAREPNPLVLEFVPLTAGKAKRLGAKLKPGGALEHLARPDWQDVSLQIMEYLVRQKFERYQVLRDLLRATGDAVLVEGNTWNDTFWGVCNGVGENHLGKILMKVRG